MQKKIARESDFLRYTVKQWLRHAYLNPATRHFPFSWVTITLTLVS